MDGRREPAPGQAPGRNILCETSRIERAAPSILWCPLVERRLRRMGDILGALRYFGGEAPQETVAWALGCTTRTVRTGAARARNLGLLERRSPFGGSLAFSQEGRSWWASVPKVGVLREEYLRLTPAQVRALEVGLRGPCSGQRGVAKRAAVSAKTVGRAFDAAGVTIVPGSYLFRGLSSDGRKVWFKKLQSYGYRAAAALIAALGSFVCTKTPHIQELSPAAAHSPRNSTAERAPPPPWQGSGPSAGQLPHRTWRPYGSGRGSESGLAEALGAKLWT